MTLEIAVLILIAVLLLARLILLMNDSYQFTTLRNDLDRLGRRMATIADNTLATRREITSVYAEYQQDREKSTKAFMDAMLAMPLPCDKQPEPVAEPMPPSLDIYLDTGTTPPATKRKKAKKKTAKKPRKRSTKK